MSVTAVREIWRGRAGSIDDEFKRTYKRVYQVVTNDLFDTALTVRQAAGIPKPFDIYLAGNDFDNGAIVVKVEPEQDTENGFLWEVSVEYETHTTDPEKENEDPLLRKADIKWTFAKFEKPLWEDDEGFAVVNSARQPFDPPPTVDDSRPVLEYTRNEPFWEPKLAMEYMDAVNTDEFLTFPAGTAKVDSISAESQYENNKQFWRVQYVFHFRRDGWLLKVLDQGFYELIVEAGLPGEGTLQEIRDKHGQPLAAPHLLDGFGRKLAPDGQPVFRSFFAYRELPFARFNIG